VRRERELPDPGSKNLTGSVGDRTKVVGNHRSHRIRAPNPGNACAPRFLPLYPGVKRLTLAVSVRE